MTAPLELIASFIENAGLAGGTTAWPLYKSFMPPTPDNAVAIFESGGDQTDGTDDAIKYDQPRFQLRVRAALFEYAAAQAKIHEIFKLLEDADIDGFVYVFAADGGPLPMGYDENNRPELSWNFITMQERV